MRFQNTVLGFANALIGDAKALFGPAIALIRSPKTPFASPEMISAGARTICGGPKTSSAVAEPACHPPGGLLQGLPAPIRGCFASGATVPLIALILAAGPGRVAHAQCSPPVPMVRFTGLGVLPGTSDSQANGVSANGSVVVGASTANQYYRAFRWTAAEGMQSLGTIPGDDRSYAYGANADGSVVVGFSDPGSSQYHAFRWTAPDGMQLLDGFAGTVQSIARSVSVDGSVIVGSMGNSAFRWTAAGGMQSLGYNPECQPSGATGVSADGSVVVGNNGFRWTTTSGLQCLGIPPYNQPLVWGVSGDGLVAVGGSIPYTNQYIPARWTAAGDAQPLASMANFPRYALATNSDGSVIVGVDGSSSFLWTAALGPLDLGDYLRTLGGNLDGWTLQYACAVSADGLTFAGVGAHAYAPGGFSRTEAWVATTALLLTDRPTSHTACFGQTVTLHVTVAGSSPPFTFSWWRDGDPLPGGNPRIAVSTSSDGRTNTVTISSFRAADAGSYECFITDSACHIVAAAPAAVTVCPADFNCDGQTNPADVAVFVTTWFTSLQNGTLEGDFDGNGVVQPADLAVFVSAWFSALTYGC